ncbi:cytochrome c [Psychromonas sp.]|uniref:c-type cytochrome n=1 Tax=Psychromonas sp. TaxID=1884585 RepID=UPI003566EA8D
MNKLLIALVAALSFSGLVQAQGNIEAGKAKSVTCAACHGADGNSPSDLYPKLAGQHATYLIKQLQEFKSGERADPIMMGMAAVLSEQDMQDLAAFYASNAATPETAAPEIAAAGQKLYMGGSGDDKMTACSACHGPRGNGLELAKFPKISSQYPAYIKTQLINFRSKARANDPNGMMSDVAAKLSDAEIELLSKYIAALH